VRRRLALLLAAFLVLTACGGDDGGTSDTDEASSGSASAPSGGATTTSGAPAPDEVAAAPSAGCGATPVVAAGDYPDETVPSSGRPRAYAQHVPPAHDGETPVPLVIDYHGYSEGGEIHAIHSVLGPFGDEQGFVTITPDSGYEVARWDTAEGSEDLVMFGDLLDQVEAQLCVDTNRVFVTGLSNGAFMTSSVACSYSDRVAAAAPVAGIRDPEGCAFDRPVPVIAFHGTQDTFIDFEGGLGSSVAELPSPDGEGTLGDQPEASEQADGPSIPEVTAAWAERNGCEPESTEERVAEDVTLQAFPCPAGAETELYVVEGGGHTWPGSEFDDSITDIVGHVTHNIDANELMWEFFQEHPLAG
jgi:polyhydroxybutyrate depolymerase